jgi:PadR family transcriptional regulator, regulatory protein AphA
VVRRELTPVSYVVLGLLTLGPATSYDLKQQVAQTIGHFWEFNHSQLYDEPARLVADGLLDERREEHGRRRRTYTITDAGRAAFAAWLGESSPSKTEVRDLGLLKLFFADLGTAEDRIRLARDQQRAHHRRAEEHERQYAMFAESIEDAESWGLATLELGMRYERMAAEFWTDLLRRHHPDAVDD